jgi:hypothetical protein
MTEKEKIERATSLLREAGELLGEVAIERQDYYEQQSEKWQDSERGSEHADKTSIIEDVQSGAFDAQAALEELN